MFKEVLTLHIKTHLQYLKMHLGYVIIIIVIQVLLWIKNDLILLYFFFSLNRLPLSNNY